MSGVRLDKLAKCIPAGGATWAVLLTLWLTPVSVRAQGAEYVESYNILVSNLNHRLKVIGSPLLAAKNGAAGETVAVTDVDTLRKKVRDLMSTTYSTGADQWNLSASSASAAFPLGLRYANGVLIKPSLMEGIGDGEGRFTKVPGQYTSGGTNVYADTFTDAPLLWEHFDELDRAIRKLRYIVAYKSGVSGWVSQGIQNARTGWASSTDWSEMLSKCNASYDSGKALNAESDYPVGYSSMQYQDAFLKRRATAFKVGGLNTSVAHRVHYFIIGSKPALSGSSSSVFYANGDPISEGQWLKWCEMGPSCESNVVSTVFGSYGRPVWGVIPPAGAQSWKGYSSDMRAVIEWQFPDYPLKRPAFKDKDNDGLLDTGCACKTCPVEMDPSWRDEKVGAEVLIPLGSSDGTLSGGLRVKAYLTEFEMNGGTQQMYSLDSRMLWRVYSNAEGWDFASIKRPSGAEVLFSLKGRQPGKPVRTTRKYEVEDRNGGIRLKFMGQNQYIYHDFLAYPSQNGALASVGIVKGTNDVYVERVSASRGLWPSLVTGYSGPSYGNPVVSFSDGRLDAVLSTNTSGLVRQVEYRYKSGGPTNRVVYYTGSKGFRVIDEHGAVIRDVRLVGDAASGSQEIWTGITTNIGLRVARKEKRRQWVDSGSGLLMVEQTDVINEGQPGAASNVTLRAIRAFDWGDETVEETAGAGTPEARTARYEYYEEPTDTNNYGRLKAVVGADGGWTRYAYDARGRERLVRRGLKSAPVGDLQACHETETVRAGEAVLASLNLPVVDQGASDDRPRLVVEREVGTEVARTYYSYQGERETTVRCVTPGALYDDPSNLVSWRTYVTSGSFKGRPARMAEEDGTLRVYAYAYDSGRKELTTTEDSGTGGEAVTNGTRRVTVVDAVGRTISEKTSDIATGMELQGRRFVRDGFGRETVTSNTVDGSASQSEYGCCGPVRVRDEGGVDTFYTHDELKRVYATERLGVTTFNTYDVFGNVAERRQCAAGMPDVVTTSAYDGLGRLAREVDARGSVVGYAYGTNALGEAVVTTTQPDGATVVETSYLDGRTKCVTGTAVRAVCYDYGADAGGRFTVEYRGADTNAACWIKTWRDMLGRTRRVEYADGYARETLYDGAGRIAGARDGLTHQVTEYNGKGEAFRSGVDMDGNGALSVGGIDRVAEAETGVGVMEGRNARWMRQYVYEGTGSAVRTLAGESWQSLDGTVTWSITHGRTNRTQVARDAARATREEVTTAPDGTSSQSSYTNGLLKQVRRLSAAGDVISRVTYEYDGLGRAAASETAGPNGKTIRAEYQFDAAGDVTGTTIRAGGTVRSEGFLYDEMGRRTKATLADGTVVRYAYKTTGELAAQAGAQTYPVEYDYDEQGRMAVLSTFRDGEGGTPDVTRWLYDDRRGWVSGKVYADGTTNRYEYRRDGRLMRRVSARGIETRYGYDEGGVMTNTAYSDGTAGVGVRVDRAGRPVEVMDALGMRGFRYGADGALVEEVLPGGAGKVEYAADALGRRTNVVVSGGAGGGYGVGYGYDGAGRVAVVTGPGMRAEYEYAADGVSVAAVQVMRNGAEVVRGGREYDDLGFLRTVEWRVGTNVAAGREYEVNTLGRRTRCGMGDGTRWEYCHDGTGQLVAARKYQADGTPAPGQQYEYGFDTIGNRISAVSDGVVTRYAANGLNQVVSYEGVGGEGVAAWQGTVYRFGVGGAGAKVAAGRRTLECGYDADGNLTNDGVWAYAWDAENRLMMASNAVKVLRFDYDYKGRRTVKKVYTKSSDSWLLAAEYGFVYDGWNVVAEASRIQNSESGTNWYVWGLDLSGTVGGAGGIGGLLYAIGAPLPGGAGGGFCYTYDGNGNVTALVDTNGAMAVSYEYDPFGNVLPTINHQPSTIPQNPFMFSTKYRDEETGQSYYGYRYYSPSLGRWLSRDPLEENGGVNLYGFVGNDGVGRVDAWGLYLVAFDGTGNNMYAGTPDSNVVRLYKGYADAGKYYPGVGSRWWSKILGGYSGLGGEVRIDNAWRDLVEHYKNMSDAEVANDPVDIIGFSRGAALARYFANIINQRGDPRQYRHEIRTSDRRGQWTVTQAENISGCPLNIRFLGIFDTVGSFGQPGNRVDVGYDFSIPPNVQNVRHAIARDESREFFPLIKIKTSRTSIEKMFPGVHSDVGGGYGDNKDIQFGPLFWMWQEGKSVGVPWTLPDDLKGWVPSLGNLMGHQSDVHFWQDHPLSEWAPVSSGDRLRRPDSWEE